MGQYVNNNIVDLGSSYDLDNAVAEIGDLIGVGARTSGTYAGKRVMADLAIAEGINADSVRKPFRSTNAVSSDILRASAVFGWNVKAKSTSETMAAFLSKLKANGVEQSYWEHLLPRSANGEWARIRDFDGYVHDAKPYGYPLTVKKLIGNDIGGTLDGKTILFPANKVTSGVIGTSSTFTCYTQSYIKAAVRLYSPNYSSSYVWDIEGVIRVNLRKGDGTLLASEEFDVYTLAQNESIYIQLFFEQNTTGGISGCYFEIEASGIWNYSYIPNPNNPSGGGEWFDVTYVIDVIDSYNVVESDSASARSGARIVPYYYQPQWTSQLEGLSGNAAVSVFGRSPAFNTIVIFELSDGSTTEYGMTALAQAYYPLFSKMGFSASMLANFTSAHYYLVVGDVTTIFSLGNQTSVPFGPITLANSHALIPYPVPYHELSLGDIKVFEAYPDDFQYVKFIFNDGYEYLSDDITENGVQWKFDTDSDLINFILAQNIYFANVESSFTATMYVEVWYQSELLRTVSQSALVSYDRSVAFAVDCAFDETDSPDAVYIRVYVEYNAVRSYLDIYRQKFQQEETALFKLGA